MTLLEFKLADEEARHVRFASPPPLPLALTLADGLKPWPSTLGLGLAPASEAHLRSSLPELRGLPDGVAGGVSPSKDLHVTLFSLRRLGRGEKPAGQAALERVRAVWRGGTFGTATGTRIVLKVKGARYDDEDECRVLAAA